MVKRKNYGKKEEILKEAYVLGYEVGYYGHYESIGWVKRELTKLEELAKEEEIENAFWEIYERGKNDSRRKRSYEVTEGKEIPVEETVINVRVERTMIRAIRRHDRRIRTLTLPKFLRRYNQF
jgi:hypothetical protein